MRKNESCFWCNKKVPLELCRRYNYKENPREGVAFAISLPTKENPLAYPMVYVCYQCEGKMNGELPIEKSEECLFMMDKGA